MKHYAFVFALIFIFAVQVSAQSLLPNASKALITPTYDGSGQAVHPSVIDFRSEYNMDSWAGYRYWLVMTPYPYKERMLENPSLLASNDGLNWIVPDHIVNPLVKNKPPDNNADVDMLYNKETNELWIYYNNGGIKSHSTHLCLIKVNEKMELSEPLLLWTNTLAGFDSSIVSPCIWKESPSRWHLWGVIMTYPNSLIYRFSTDGIHWGKPVICKDAEGKDPFASKGVRAWHPSCKPNYIEKRIEFLVASRTDTNRKSPQSLTTRSVYAECPMNNPSQVSLPFYSPVLSKSDTGWDNKLIYRSSFIIENDRFAYRYRIWYSGCNIKDRWGIGVTEGYICTDNSLNLLAEQKKMISKLYPNLGRDNCLIKIKIRHKKDAAEFVLYNQNGSKFETRKLKKGMNRVIVDLKSLPRDNYLYVINFSDHFVEGGKLPGLTPRKEWVSK